MCVTLEIAHAENRNSERLNQGEKLRTKTRLWKHGHVL